MNFIHPSIRCQLERIEEEFRHEIRSVQFIYSKGLLSHALIKFDHCPPIDFVRVTEKNHFHVEPAVSILGTGPARFKPMAVYALIDRIKTCLSDLVQCEGCRLIGEYSGEWHGDSEGIYTCPGCLEGCEVTE